MGTLSANKGYIIPTVGGDVGTWGTELNQTIPNIDLNIGGNLPLSVAGNSNVVLTTAQAQNLIYKFTGVLTGNITVAWPAGGGFYIVQNATTGAYSLTCITVAGGSTGVAVPQGTTMDIQSDATNISQRTAIAGLSITATTTGVLNVQGTVNVTVGKTLTVNDTLTIATSSITLASESITLGGSPVFNADTTFGGADGKTFNINSGMTLASSVGDGKTLDIGGGANLSQFAGAVALSGVTPIIDFTGFTPGTYAVHISNLSGGAYTLGCLVSFNGTQLNSLIQAGSAFGVSASVHLTANVTTATFNVYYSLLVAGAGHA